MIADAPKVLTLNVTTSCDAACRYCHWWRDTAEPETLEALLDAVDEAASAGVAALRLSGGEPLLRPDLPHLVARSRSHGLVSMVCTAAKCGLPALEALPEAGLDLLSVSLDTLEEEAFCSIRGYPVGPVLENIKALAGKRSGSGFEIVLSVVLSRLSIKGLPELLEYARSLDLLVSFTPYQDGSPTRPSSKNALALRKSDDARLRQALRLVREAAVSGLRVVNADTFLEGIADFLLTRRLPAGHVCRAGDAAAIRMAGGELKLCHSLPGIAAGGLRAAWGSNTMQTLRERMARQDCPGCWLSCHADPRRPVPHRYGRPEIWEAL